ncbi:MAG: hypothetical protein ACE5JH_08180 [Acidobacteriota bacterium]
MIDQDEVFVITEEDILKPGPRVKGRGGNASTPRKGLFGFGRSRGEPASRAPGGQSAVGRVTPPPVRRSRVSSPAAAGTLSLFVCGLGQFYNGQRRLATLFLLCELQVIAFHYMLYMIWDRIREFAHLFFVSEWEMLLYASSLDFCLIFFLIYNVAQAYRGAEARAGRFDGMHRPAVSGLASFLVPGWGQILNGQMGKAILFLFAFLLQVYCLVLYLHSPLFRVITVLDEQQLLLRKALWVGMAVLFVTALSWFVSVYDAVLVARYTRR